MAPNKNHMVGPLVEIGFVDKRKTTSITADGSSHIISRGVAPFTANAGGTATTIVGANAAPGTNDNNVIRRTDKFRLFTGAGVLKEETVFQVTAIAVAGSTTVTFTPAAAVVTANGDVARIVDYTDYQDNDDINSRLSGLGYTDPQINVMSLNDKVFAIRQADNVDSI